jgi:hypothetical protein
MQYNGYKDLKVYQLAYKLAMEIFKETKGFPPEEKLPEVSRQISQKHGRKENIQSCL